jgi:ABC-2 type transport system ATP-binding protein
MRADAVAVTGLRKSYADVEAVAGVDFAVGAGEIFALLGPNGAGKTTIVEILEGYRDRDGGEVSVLGADPARPGRRWRERIGIVLQSSALDPFLTVRETLAQFAGYYPAPLPVAETLALAGLADDARTRVGRLSGGRQRRLDVAVALIGDPDLLFLDEPTTGFDPAARQATWATLRSVRDRGKAIVLTTHYMEEAQRLADTIAIVVRGRVVAAGRPRDLIGRYERSCEIRFELPAGAAAEVPPAFGAVLDDGAVRVRTVTPARTLNELSAWALDRGLDLAGLEVSRASLEDVYLHVTKDG